MLKTIGLAALVLIFFVLMYLLYWPVRIDPIAWTPPKNPGFDPPYTQNDGLGAVDLIAHNRIVGPEDIAFGPGCTIYTGLVNGRIVRIDPETGVVDVLADTGGIPLGIHFDAGREHLYIADARRGLLRLRLADSPASLEALSEDVDGEFVRYTDNLHIDSNGIVWFSSPGQRFGIEDIRLDGMETRPTGRLFSYDPANGEFTLHLDELMFANGVAMPRDEKSILVNEWYGYRVTRLWLEGPRQGKREILADNLPGYPDNLFVDDEDRIWVGLVIERDGLVDWLHRHPFLMKILARIPAQSQPAPRQYGWIIALDQQGNVIANVQDNSGRFGRVTGAKTCGGDLYLTTNENTAIGRIPLEDIAIRQVP